MGINNISQLKFSSARHQIGFVISRLMKKVGIDESSLAKACNMSLASLSRIKNNPNSNPTISTIKPISDFFEITVGQLLGYEPLENNNKEIKKIPIIKTKDIKSWLNSRSTISPIEDWIITTHELTPLSFSIKLNIKTNVLMQDAIVIVDPKKEILHHSKVLILNVKDSSYHLRIALLDDREEVYLSPIESSFMNYIPVNSSLYNNISIIGSVVEIRM